MDIKDIIFIVMCVVLVCMMVYYVDKLEVYKLNVDTQCLENVKRICVCTGKG